MIFLFTMSMEGQAQFFLNGSAVAINDSCYQLTPATNSQVGSIWNGDLVNLNESFEVIVDIFLGCEDLQGADGIVFGLQPVSTSIGGSGGGIGFGDVQPSLGVEFDTYQNADFGDPFDDHMTIIRDGVLNHNLPQGALAGPVQASATAANVEDCQYHALRLTWDATAQTLSAYFDCELRLTYTGDIVNDIFGGDPLVFWGFTSGTGGLNNEHEICFNYISFINELVDQTICPGEEIQLESGGGVSYSWSPAEGLSDPTIANPIASPTETTLYTVEIIDDCGIPFFDDVLVTVDNDQFTVNIGSDPNETTVPVGTELNLSTFLNPDVEGYTFSWSSMLGSTFSSPDSANTVLTVATEDTGAETISVLVTSEAGCVQEAILDLVVTGPLYSIPNIFSPNGDGNNDIFGVFTAATLTNYRCEIYNRWGKLVYESDDYTAFWDGNYEGKTAPSDEYLYQFSFGIGAFTFTEGGSLTLLR